MTAPPSPCETLSDDQLCAVVSRRNGEDPIGSASKLTQIVVLELPPPWPRNALSSPQLAAEAREVLARLGRSDLAGTLLTVEPDPAYSQPGHTRVLEFRHPEGLFANFLKRDFLVPDAQLAGLLDALLFAHDPTGDPAHDPAHGIGAFARYAQATQNVRDLLVCTHGNRDVCCWRFGEAAYQALRFEHAKGVLDGRTEPGSVRVWRTSHIGGHKFAPTLIDLPDGRTWGHLEAPAYAGLLARSLPMTDLRRFYRGWCGASKLEQVAERAVFAREGWVWTELPKEVRTVARTADETTVQLHFIREGQLECYEATVVCTGTVETLPSSGDAQLVTLKQYGVRSLAALTPPPRP